MHETNNSTPVRRSARPSRRDFLTYSAGTLAAAALGGVLSACGDSGGTGAAASTDGGAGPSKSGSEGDQLRFSFTDLQPGTMASPYIAVFNELNLFEKYELKPDLVKVQIGDALSGLVAKAFDVSYFGTLSAISAMQQGNQVRIIGPALNDSTMWVVQADSNAKDLGDLEGMKIGSPPESGQTYKSAALASRLAGWSFPEKYQVVTGANTALVGLFEKGEIEATIMSAVSSANLIASGKGRALGSVEEIWKDYTDDDQSLFFTGPATMAPWLDDHGDGVSRIRMMFQEASKHLHDNPDRLGEYSEALTIDGEKGLEEAKKLIPQYYGFTWDDATIDSVRKQIDLAEKFELVDKGSSKYVDDIFVI